MMVNLHVAKGSRRENRNGKRYLPGLFGAKCCVLSGVKSIINLPCGIFTKIDHSHFCFGVWTFREVHRGGSENVLCWILLKWSFSFKLIGKCS
jgi:hypothetical protein